MRLPFLYSTVFFVTSSLAIYFPSSSLAIEPSSLPTEISTTSDSWAWIPPDTLRITLQFESTAKDATTALAALKRVTSATKDSLNTVAGEGIIILDRGHSLSGGAQPGAPIATNKVVKAQQYIGIETTNMSLASTLIDSSLASGANSVSEVSYLVRHDEVQKAKAITSAASKAKLKAEALANSLGVKLGKLLSATVTEEPIGRTRRLMQKAGGSLNDYSDTQLHVYVNLRYEVS